jgi:hypothetical protein
MEYGDILLNNNKEIYGLNGDLATGNGQVHQVCAIVEAVSGNFRRTPTLASNLVTELDGVTNGREITAKIIDAMVIDGWELNELTINDETDDKIIVAESATKITDNTNSLI